MCIITSTYLGGHDFWPNFWGLWEVGSPHRNSHFPLGQWLVSMHAQNIVLQHKGARHMRRLHYSEAKPDSADRSLRRAPFEGFGSSMVKHIRFYHKTVWVKHTQLLSTKTSDLRPQTSKDRARTSRPLQKNLKESWSVRRTTSAVCPRVRASKSPGQSEGIDFKPWWDVTSL